MKKVLIVVGTRPNFIKVTQFKKLVEAYPSVDLRIVHTGQHFDAKMADVFFQQLALSPDFFLNIPVGSPTSQMAEIMVRLEKLIVESFRPDILLVVGDVNSTLAAAITANKLGITLGHIESGLRSKDRTMPEEINRILTDEISDLFFVTEKSGVDNLLNEGKAKAKIHFVGNTMIDTLVAFEKEITRSDILETYSLKEREYVLMTMHRPATVDNEAGLAKLMELIESITKSYTLIFPIHPRTLKKLGEYHLLDGFNRNKKVIVTDPLDYFSFQKLIKHSKFILTDSGGIQEESTFMRVPCITLRPNTERPVTCEIGSNSLLSFETEKILAVIKEIENGTYKKGLVPEYWDGSSTNRILEIISK
jgi:UDP-N-acetylglucosamine 2-epimerase (non-hydrolysing)